MAKPAHGTIFAVPLPDGTYVCGRVMLDIEACLRRRLFPNDSPLPFYRDGHLVEMYSATSTTPVYVPSPVSIPGAFVEKKEIGKAWPVVGEARVDPRTVEFPETLIGFQHPHGGAAFECGEIHLPVPMVQRPVVFEGRRDLAYFSPSVNEGVRSFGTRHNAFYWHLTCLWAMGRHAEVPAEVKCAGLVDYDLRFSPLRAPIYNDLPFRMEQSYFEKQATLGLGFERLYAEDR
jgi:hypothetical protein